MADDPAPREGAPGSGVDSLILSVATRFLTPLILAFSVFVLLRGHNEPGGGFVGGLLAGVAFCLYATSEGTAAVRRALRVAPEAVAMAGVGLAIAAGLWGLAARGSLFAGVWPFLTVTGAEKSGSVVGSALLFDTGVYLVVVGTVCAMVFALEDDLSDREDR
jgi:multicomponent Na+:H+ antiporter subunit B